MSTRILVVDIGNTKSKLALSEDGVLTSGVTLSDHETTVAEALRIAATEKADGCLISCVAQGAKSMAARMRAGGLHATLLSSSMKFPFTVAYKTPLTLGPDRLADVTGVVASFGMRNAIIIDAGTAITYDFLTAEGVYLGGAISPGIGMRFKALHAFTAKLPMCSATQYDGEFVGQDTRSAVRAGVMNGVLAEAKEFIARASELMPNAIVVVTGGDYKYFEFTTEMSIFARPNLVLEGLACVAKYNQELILS